MRVVAETAEIQQLPLGEKIVAIPEVRTVQGTQTSESFTVAGKFHREFLMRGVAPNMEADSFIDDLSSVGSKVLNHQDCEVLSHAGMKRTIQQLDGSHQQQQDNQPQAARQSTRQERERKKGEKGRRKDKEREKEDKVKR